MGLVIGLTGAKGSGKDQFYKAAKAAFPHLDVRKIAFADPIKHEVCRIFELEGEEEYDLFKRTHLDYALPGHFNHTLFGRHLVREIGMMMRSYDEQQFVRYVRDEIEHYPDAIWCVTDLRFDNELEALRDMDAVIVKIKRGGMEYDGHVTETEFADEEVDTIIHNVDLTVEQYNELAVSTMENILETIQKMKEYE